jgi:amidase
MLQWFWVPLLASTLAITTPSPRPRSLVGRFVVRSIVSCVTCNISWNGADYTQFLAGPEALKGAVFGLPWKSFWVHAREDNLPGLLRAVKLIEEAGGRVINNTEIRNYETTVAQNGWDWLVLRPCTESRADPSGRDWGSTRGRPNESEFTVVKIDFYNNIKSYLAELNHSNVHSLEDIVAYNNANDGTEGGTPGVLPAFASGQDSFLASLASKGIRDETYWQALGYVQRATREDGIDASVFCLVMGFRVVFIVLSALHYTGADGKALVLDGLLVPSDAGQTYQIAAQAGKLTMSNVSRLSLTTPRRLSDDHHTRFVRKHDLWHPAKPAIFNLAGINSWGMPYGLGIMHTAWSESILVKWGSAIEALVQGRQRPTWYMAGAKNIPVILED